MKRAKNFFAAHKKIVYVGAAVLVVAGVWWYMTGGNGAPAFETAIVERGTVTRIVSETGAVEAADEVDLAFTSSGRIVSVDVAKGQRVTAGQVLVRLEAAAAQASLAQAQAALRSAEAQVVSGSGTREQHDQLVASAYRRLLSANLEAVPDRAYDVEPPVITGSYTGAEGTYKLRISRKASGTGSELRTYGVETSGPTTILKNEPTPMGTRGLYVSFPDDMPGYDETDWTITLPNTAGGSYLTNLNSYQEALRARDLALTSSDNAAVLAAGLDHARAAVAAAQAALAQTRITAPFDGIVTDIAVTAGEIASPGAVVASIISSGRYEITVEIPEDDIVGLEVGDHADITFDALPDTMIGAQVMYVAPAAKTADGAVTFEVTLQLAEDDPRVLAGLTADADILVDERTDVLVVPVRAVVEEDAERYVRVLVGEKTYQRVPVTVGLRGGGFYEVTSGLQGGERIITFANAAALAELAEEVAAEGTSGH